MVVSIYTVVQHEVFWKIVGLVGLCTFGVTAAGCPVVQNLPTLLNHVRIHYVETFHENLEKFP